MRKWSIASALVAVMLLLGSVSGQQPAAPDTFVAGELLVKFQPGLNTAQRNNILAVRRAARIRRFASLDIEHIRVPQGLSVQAAMEALRSMPGVMYVQPNYKRHVIQGVPPPPNDPFWLDGSLWGLVKIQAQEAWTNFTTGDGSVIVAGIDTGIDYTHPDLAANMWHNPVEIPGNGIDDDGNGYVDDVYGIDTVNHDSNPMDDQGHGTHTAGTIAAVGNNDLGVVGVSTGTRRCSRASSSTQRDRATDAGAIECFNYIVAMKNRGENIRVTSNSWGAAARLGPAVGAAPGRDRRGRRGRHHQHLRRRQRRHGQRHEPVRSGQLSDRPASCPSRRLDRPIGDRSSATTARRRWTWPRLAKTSSARTWRRLRISVGHEHGDAARRRRGGAARGHESDAVGRRHQGAAARQRRSVVAVDRTRRVRRPAECVQGGSGGRRRQRQRPPSVSLDVRPKARVYKAPVTISLDGVASDSDGTIQQVSFYANGVADWRPTRRVRTASSWTGVRGQLHADRGRDRRSFGDGDIGAAVHIIVCPNTPPTVSLTSPSRRRDVHVAGDRHDRGDGQRQRRRRVSRWRSSRTARSIGTDATSPFSVTWNAPLGSYTSDGRRDRQRGRDDDVGASAHHRQSDSGPHQRRARVERRRRDRIVHAEPELSGVRRDQRRPQRA